MIRLTKRKIPFGRPIMTDILPARLKQTTDIVSAYVRQNTITTEQLATLIQQVQGTLAGLGDEPKPRPEPAVPIRRSITRNYVVCLECGKRGAMLKRHLSSAHDLTPEEYRERWGLPRDHPIVAPKYAEKRSELAKKIGLGRKPRKRSPRKKR